MKYRFSFAFLICWTTPIALAQSCVDSIIATTNVQKFQTNANGTVRFGNTMWTRCALGQTWQKGNCSGQPVLVTWAQAIEVANNSKMLSHNDWRLPNIYELSAITELRCQNPAINLKIFPDAPSVSFWANTEFINNQHLAWQVFFGSGENHSAKKSTLAAIRLVRTIAITRD